MQERYQIAVPGESAVLHSATDLQSLRHKEAAGPDTFALYGYADGYTTTSPPNTDEGRFQVDGYVPDRGGWISVDRTDLPVYWQISQFNAENLNGNGAGNHAVWCGQTAAQQPGWVTAPGYGNGWTDVMRFREQVSDPTAGQTVSLDFFFNHETEYGYDWFTVRYDSAGVEIPLYSIDGSNIDASGIFQPPGVQYSSVATRDVVYAGNDYSGDDSDEIVIELAVETDGAWSDEDGLWPTEAGAAQVDDISVTTTDGSYFEDFEAGTFRVPWLPVKSPYHGDFARVRARLEDIDPCAENFTPLFTFIDAGQTVNNDHPIWWYPSSTGGQTSLNWNYGIPGGWVLNYTGGVSFGETAMFNEIWSPEIDWDTDPNVTDASDDPEVVGARIRFDVWTHLPLVNGLLAVWHVRSSPDGEVWSSWSDRSVGYHGGLPRWISMDVDVTDLILDEPEKVQMALGVIDLSEPFSLPGTDATVSPAYDNAAFYKYRLAGPSITARAIDLAQDGFPISGSIDVAGAKGDLDIPFEMAQDVARPGNPEIDTGDSIVCDVRAIIPGTALTDLRMVWVLDRNPLFDDVRSVPSRPVDLDVIAGPERWYGEVLADSSTTSDGTIIAGRYFFDLPDTDFLQPGDVLRYYLRADDDAGHRSTLPADTTGFATGVGYDRVFTVHGLPSILDAQGSQPTKLVYDDAGSVGDGGRLLQAFGQLGLEDGLDYDVFTTVGPTSGLSNGLGSAGGHGATAGQLAGYQTIVYLAGDLITHLLSDGSDNGAGVDKSDDLGVLTGWHDLAGERFAVHFGDNLFSGLTSTSMAGNTYVETILGADLHDPDVRDDIDGQTAPVVQPVHAAFTQEFVAYGGCAGLNQFDRVQPLSGAVRGHGFVDPAGAVYPLTAASLIHDRLVDGDRKVDLGFPFGLTFVRGSTAKTPVLLSAPTQLLKEAFELFGVPSGGPDVVATPPHRRVTMAVHPNPFNPTTTVEFSNLPEGSQGTVRVFNLRGEEVAVLHDGPYRKRSRFVWDGTDTNGASVASGVYLVEGRAGGFRGIQKVALVK